MNNQPGQTQGWVNMPPLPSGATMNQSPYPPGPAASYAEGMHGGPPPSGMGAFNPSAPPSGGFNSMPPVFATNAPMLSNPSAPAPAEPGQPGFASFPGFADSTFDPTIQPPTNPFFNPADADIPNDYKRSTPSTVTALSEEEVLLAVKEYADKTCCLGPPNNEIKVEKIEMKNAFKYQLNSFTEQRRTAWHSEPFFNQTIDGPTMTPVGPWDIKVFPDAMFANQEKKMQIPNTSSVRPCQKCYGSGRDRCHYCDGVGWKNCTWCNGSGRRNDGSDCSSCDRGRNRCTSCSGNGYSKCTPCNGRGQLFMYLKLIVTWKSHVDEFISDSTTVPKELLSKTKGSSAISEQNRVVYPFTNFPDQAIVNSSKELITKHARDYTSQSVILEQKQTVDLVRIAEVDYTYKEKSGKFHVFGETNDVYFPDYPVCDCSCTIL